MHKLKILTRNSKIGNPYSPMKITNYFFHYKIKAIHLKHYEKTFRRKKDYLYIFKLKYETLAFEDDYSDN